MTKKIKDLVVKTGTYEKGGETKGRFMNVGAVMESNDGGKFIILDRTFNPAGVPNPDGRSTLIISMFDVDRDKQAGGDHKGFDKQGDPAGNKVSDDEIPF